MLANNFYIQPPRSPNSILLFLSVGSFKALVYSVAIEN